MLDQCTVTLAEAVTRFLSTLSPEERQQGQTELSKFVRWCGGDRAVGGITVREVAGYSESINAGDAAQKLEPVKAFLSYIKKEKLIEGSLASHVRPNKSRKTSPQAHRRKKEGHVLTADGHAALKSELEELKSQRGFIVEQIKNAAADKDFKENSPLDAAKDHQGHVEGRIRELEATLTGATVLDQAAANGAKVMIGSKVILRDLTSDRTVGYCLVSPSEASPSHGKLSIVSPTGKALLDQRVGALVEVVAPIGKLKYRIEDIQC